MSSARASEALVCFSRMNAAVTTWGFHASSGYRVNDSIVLEEHREARIVPTGDRWRTDRVVLGNRRAELRFHLRHGNAALGFLGLWSHAPEPDRPRRWFRPGGAGAPRRSPEYRPACKGVRRDCKRSAYGKLRRGTVPERAHITTDRNLSKPQAHLRPPRFCDASRVSATAPSCG